MIIMMIMIVIIISGCYIYIYIYVYTYIYNIYIYIYIYREIWKRVVGGMVKSNNAANQDIGCHVKPLMS